MDEQSIFLQALERPEGDARDQWLAEVCGTDSALKERIAALLKREAEKGSFLETPLSPLDATVLHDLGSAVDRVAEDSNGPVGGRVIEGLLKSLGGEFDIPRVSLREEDGVDPILRTGSKETRSSPVDSRYQLIGEIARGGMGAILKGRDNDLGRDLAIKVLLDSHRDKPEVIQRFIEEAQIGGQLQHPGIAPIYDLGRFADNRPFFAMKLVKGQTLSKLLSDRHATSDERSRFLGIFENVCQTVGYAHSRGVIHRDLKPANIMVGAFGEVQVMDWGLAKVLADGGVNDERRAHSKHNGHSVIETIRTGAGSDSLESVGTAGSHTQVGSVMGTPAYMPPEQALGEVHSMDERADVFALGAILCEILTGKPPYVADDGTRLFRMAMRGKLDDCFARLASCDADEELIALTKDCLELDPIDRPRDAGVLANRVRGYLESVEARLREAETERAAQTARAEAEALRLAQQQQATRKLQRMLAGLAAVALLALGASVVAGLFWQRATVARNQAQANETLARNNAERADKNAQEAEQQAALAMEQRQLAEQNLIKTRNAERETAIARDTADQKAELASRNLYFAQMRLAQKSFYDYRSVQRMRDLLGNWIPKSGEVDRRGWEWFYLNSLSYRNVRTLSGKEPNPLPRAVAWHAKSKRLADGVVSGRIRVWDLDREEPILVLTTPSSADVYWGRRWIAWNPEGDKLVAGFDDKTVRVWDTRTGEEILVLQGQTSSVVSVSFNGDGSRIAACGKDGLISIWDAATGQLSSSIAHPSGVNTGAWSHDGQWYATGHISGEMIISETNTGTRLAGWRAQPGWFHGLEWSPDDKRIATTGIEGTDRFMLRVWDVAMQQLVFEPQRHNHGVTALAWEPNGQRIATGTMAEEIRIWDSESGRELNSLRGHTESITSLAWGTGGSLASVATDGELKIWKSIQDQQVTKVPGDIILRSVRWSPDGKMLATADDHGRIRIRNANTGQETMTVQAHEPRNFSEFEYLGFDVSVAWSPDSNHLASAGLDGVLKIWEAGTGHEVSTHAIDFDRVWCVDWSKDGKHIAIGSQDGHIRIVEAFKTDPQVQSLMAHHVGAFGVTGVAWSPTGDRLASCGNDRRVKVWDVASGVELSNMEGHGGWIFSVAWSHDGKQLASSGADGNVITWDVATGQKQMKFRSGQEFVMAVAWNPEGNRLASAHLSGDIQVWDTVSGEECCSFHIPFARFYDVSWNPDGARIAAASNLGDLCIWDATQGFERDPTPRALPYIDRALALGTVTGIDRLWYARTYLREGNREKARESMKTDLLGLMQLANLHEEIGDVAVARETRRQARTLAEKELLIDPSNPNAADSLIELLLREIEDNAGSTKGRASAEDPQSGVAPAMVQPSTFSEIRKMTDRWGAIAAAYQLLGEELSLARVLRDHPKASLSLADLDASMKKWNAAIEEYSRWITPETNDVDLLHKRGSAYFAVGKWEPAREDWLRAVEIRPNPELTESIYEQFRRSERWQDALPFGRKLIDINPGAEPELVWLRIAPVAALAGDDAYREFCQQMLSRVQNTTDPLVADRLIKACLLRPGCIDLQLLPHERIKEDLDSDRIPTWARPWVWATYALWAYRSGNPELASRSVANSEALQPAIQVHQLNLAILALAEQDLNHPEPSRLALQELSQLMAQARQSSDTPGTDSLLVEVLLREAQAKVRNP